MRLHREKAGSGLQLVLSHGLGDDASTWSALVPLLTHRFTVVTWDLRGHGQSEAPSAPDAYTSEIAVADLLGVIGEVDEAVHLIGHSLGGYLSLAVALRRPELVRSLTLVASGPGYRDPEARQTWNAYVEQAVVDMPVPRLAAGLARQESSWVIDHVGELASPLLLLVGERDTRFHPGAAFLNRAVPGSTLQHVAGAGHQVQRSHAEAVAAAVLAHIDAAQAGGER